MDADDRRSRLEQLRASRASKKSSSSNGDVYDTVTDEEYRAIVKGRMQEDDFIEDDDGGGYVDYGLEEWDQSGESDGEMKAKKKTSTSMRSNNGPKPKKGVQKQTEVRKGHENPYAKPSMNNKVKEDDFMDSLLNDLTPTAKSASSRQPRTAKKRKSDIPQHLPTASSDVPSSDGLFQDQPSKGFSSETYTDDDYKDPKKFRRGSSSLHLGSDPDIDINGMQLVSDPLSSDIKMEDDEVEDQPVLMRNKFSKRPLINGSSIKAARPKSPTSVIKKEDNPEAVKLNAVTKKKELKEFNWKEAAADVSKTELAEFDLPQMPKGRSKAVKAAAQEAANLEAAKYNVFEDDGSLNVFWLDFTEVAGVVHLIGKVFDRNSRRYLSCCISVFGIERNIYVLPKGSRKRSSGDSEGEDDDNDKRPSQDDVYENFDSVLRENNVTNWGGKFVTRKYAFEIAGIPEETEWLKAVYSFDQPELPHTLNEGPTFSHVLGKNTSAFELFVLKRKIMGPCWLRVENAERTIDPTSWCKVEFNVSSPKSVNPFVDGDSSAPKNVPPLTILSVSLRTVVNHKDNKSEIVCTNVRVYQDTELEDTTPIEVQDRAARSHTAVRPLSAFPVKFDQVARQNGILPCNSERVLLNNLLGTISRYDPDVIVGHDFLGVTLDILLNRLRDLKCDHFSRIGRIRKSKWPSLHQRMNVGLLTGRLGCDLASDAAHSIIQSTTWSLTEMTQSVLGKEREDIDPEETASYFDSFGSPERLLEFVKHCEIDSYYQMAIASKVQILALTKQLTNLAGNSWNRTLNGGRAERNEYILLHEFHKQKFICPDKQYRYQRQAARKNGATGEEEQETSSKSKQKYKGGLVFDPKRGLYDTFILVMDFNSLYPSIIQEYNIDFTTVLRHHIDDDEKVPDIPDSDVKQGVLPKLIATLVNRRRQVKSLMKDKNAPASKQLQWDIKQLALKLTANSMYGCLGFEGSRFYARSLAVLTTFKGREILTNTRELAEGQQLEVIYGDTDSIMINTHATEHDDALKVGIEFKKLVNERYRLLEIDIDATFKRMLLLQKKKYAALKVEGNGEEKTEIKGLDMKRREYCQLSKTVSKQVLDEILSGEAKETVVENIHEYLTKTANEIRDGVFKVEPFIINKRLGKNLKEYTDAKSQPQVQVGLRMQEKGQSVKAGDVIRYIFCIQDGVEQSNQALRAYSPEELNRASDLRIDYEHYLSLQILPPVERICDPIEGTDRCRIAECLGLDSTRYRVHAVGEEAEKEFHTLESQISDAERFKNVDDFVVQCRWCETKSVVSGCLQRYSEFLTCPNENCSNRNLEVVSLCTQVENQIRQHIGKFYEGWMVCDDSSCSHRTRMISVVGKKCLRPSCSGSMQFEYPHSMLYTQLLYYHRLFDIDTAKRKATGTTNQDDVDGLFAKFGNELRMLSSVADRYLQKSGHRFLSLDNLFSTLRLRNSV